MTYEAETRKAFYSAGEFFGVAKSVIRRKGDPSPDPDLTFVNVIARLAEAKGCGKGEFTTCGKEAIRSEDGQAALVRFVDLWPKIKGVAEGLIETGDISGEHFAGEVLPASDGRACGSTKIRWWREMISAASCLAWVICGMGATQFARRSAPKKRRKNFANPYHYVRRPVNGCALLPSNAN